MLARYNKNTHELEEIAPLLYGGSYLYVYNKPQVNSVELNRNKTTIDLGLFDGDYDSLINKPVIPDPQVQADWDQLDSREIDYIKNKPNFSFNQSQADWDQSDDQQVDFIKNKPIIPDEQVQADWVQSDNTEIDYIKNKPTVPTAISQLQNNSGFIDNTVNYLTYYSTTTQSDALLATKSPVLTFDSVPTQGSTNPISSGGAYAGTSQLPHTYYGTRESWGQLTPEQKSKYTDVIFNDPVPEHNVIYGFSISGSASDPAQKVSYLLDAAEKTPAFMDTTNFVFNYGSWGGAFFYPKPCMLGYDGTVAYYLDPNDYSKKIDGTASDVGDNTFLGNAMLEWPKIYMKIEPVQNDPYSANIYISDYKPDSSYHCWNYIDSSGNEVDHFYTAIYPSSYWNNNDSVRSLSGMSYSRLESARGTLREILSTSITRARYHNSDSVHWDVQSYSDWILITCLAILMCKTTDVSTAFNLRTSASTSQYTTGIANAAGLFGYDSMHRFTKFFGMEFYSGYFAHFVTGLIIDKNTGVAYTKLCYGTADGSTQSDYDTIGAGYVISSDSEMSLLDGTVAYVNCCYFTDRGFIPFSNNDMPAADLYTYYQSNFDRSNISAVLYYPVLGSYSNMGNVFGIYRTNDTVPALVNPYSYFRFILTYR